MLVAIHQPNFIPWFPYFEKMAIADRFVIMKECQFEKNGYQNRAKINDKWWTNPVYNGKLPIKEKSYITGHSLLRVNYSWICVLADTLGISKGRIMLDTPTDFTGTERIIEICKRNMATTYITNPEAFDKYLDKNLFVTNKINIMEFKSKHPKHVFEMFDEYGIEGTRKILQNTVEEYRGKH